MYILSTSFYPHTLHSRSSGQPPILPCRESSSETSPPFSQTPISDLTSSDQCRCDHPNTCICVKGKGATYYTMCLELPYSRKHLRVKIANFMALVPSANVFLRTSCACVDQLVCIVDNLREFRKMLYFYQFAKVFTHGYTVVT